MSDSTNSFPRNFTEALSKSLCKGASDKNFLQQLASEFSTAWRHDLYLLQEIDHSQPGIEKLLEDCLWEKSGASKIHDLSQTVKPLLENVRIQAGELVEELRQGSSMKTLQPIINLNPSTGQLDLDETQLYLDALLKLEVHVQTFSSTRSKLSKHLQSVCYQDPSLNFHVKIHRTLIWKAKPSEDCDIIAPTGLQPADFYDNNGGHLIMAMEEVVNNETVSKQCAASWQSVYDNWFTAQNNRVILESSLEHYRAANRDQIEVDGVTHWADPAGLNPSYLRKSHFEVNQTAPAMDPSPTNICKSGSGAGTTFQNCAKSSATSILALSGAIVQSGSVVYPSNVQSFIAENSSEQLALNLRYHQFTDKEAQITRWARVLEFCARVRSISLALLDIYKADSQNQSSLEAATRLYNAYSTTMAIIHNVLAKYHEVSELLDRIADAEDLIESSIRTLHGLLRSGEYCYLGQELAQFGGSVIGCFEARYKSMCKLNYTDRLPTGTAGFAASGKLSQTQSTPWQNDATQRVVYGWRKLDISANTQFRAATQDPSSTAPTVYTWNDTQLYQAETSWLSVPAAGLKHVEFDQTPDRAFKPNGNGVNAYTCWINFKKSFSKVPFVACWFTCLDVNAPVMIKVEASVDTTTTEGALLKVEVQYPSLVVLDNVRLNWIAYDQSREAGERISVVQANIGGPGAVPIPGKPTELWPQILTSPNRGQFVRFSEGKYKEAPKVMVGLSSFFFISGASYRINLEHKYETKDGVWVQVDTWDGTVLADAEVVVVAFA